LAKADTQRPWNTLLRAPARQASQENA
jgi:hypothetical protein